MREAEKIIKTDLTKIPKPPYARGGEIFMEGKPDMAPQNSKPANGENLPHGVDEATRRLEQAARQGEARRVLEENENLPVEVRRVLEGVLRGGNGEKRQERQQTEVKTGTATWKSKDADQPINVTGYLGRGTDGREYVSVEGSDVGIPLDEIEFPTQAAETGVSSGGGEIKPPPPTQTTGAGGAGVPPGGGEPPAPPSTGDRPEEPNNQGENHAPEGEPPSVVDRTAANLIAKFRQEHGENDPAKIQQFRRNLSGRIEELTKERIGLGAREGSTTPEGELTPAAAAEIAEIDNRIREIQSFIADVFSTEESEDENPDVRKLLTETNQFVNGLLKRGLKRNQINDLANLTEPEKATRTQLVRDIREFIEGQPAIETSSFPPSILLAVRNFTELREQLISDILFKSFEDRSETNEYEVGLYAASNLDILLGFLSKDDNERYRELFSLRTATRFFQTMNSTVIKGTFDSFGHSAENINYQHFENMRDIGGSGLAMRLFEQAYRDTLAVDKRVTQDKIAGIKEYVETTFKEINEAGLIRSEYAEYRTDYKDYKMENWEIQRALAAGRTFFNITLRAAENIATGQVPSDRKRITSPPQEDMVRILNWNQWLLARFIVGGGKEGRHGEEFLKMSTDKWEEFLRYKGAKLDKNKIIEFGGVNVRKMEEGGQYRTSGVYSGWRMENLAFDEIYLKDLKDKDDKALRDEKKRVVKPGDGVLRDKDGAAFVSVQCFMDSPLIPEDLLERLKKRDMATFLDKTKLEKGEITILDAVKALRRGIQERGEKNPSMDPARLTTKQDQEDYKDLLMPVVNNLNFGLSMLLKNGDFGAQDSKLGYLLREEIWRKIANTNTPLMIDYLTDIKYATEKEQKEILGDTETVREPEIRKARSIKDLRNAIVPEWSNDEHDERWEAFRKKVLVRFERTIREGMGEQLPSVDAKYELNMEEKNLEDAIKEQGQRLAPHLADIVFAYMPFMNDMPFEKFNYVYLGQTFYKRRSTNDLGGFNKGQQAYTKILSNPGGIPVKDAVAAMGEIIAGVESPEGPRPAIEANFPTFSALLDVVTTDPGKRQAIFKMLLEATRSETSIAQRWQGIKANSFIESEVANLIDETLKAGILTPQLARYLKKEKHLTLPFILWMLFRDVFLITVPVSIATELFGAVKGK